MSLIVAIIGHISAGKTSTARLLAAKINATYIGSDDLRKEICGDDSPAIDDREFIAMEHRLAACQREHQPVVLDSTGMTRRFRDMLARYRDTTKLVLLYCHTNTWETREVERKDRFPLTPSLYAESQQAAASLQPDLTIDTTGFAPDDIARLIETWLSTETAATI